MRESRKYSYGAELQLKEMAFVCVTFSSASVWNFGCTQNIAKTFRFPFGISLRL